MPNLSVNAVNLHYEESGAGLPVVFLHGLGSCGVDWWLQTPAFSRHFRVVCPTLRGHPPSSPIRGPLRIDTLAADVAHLLDALTIERAHVVGLSLGGAVAQVLAADFPGKVDRLVLVNTFAHLRPTTPRETYTLARRVVISRLLPPAITAKVVGRDLFPRPEQAALRELALRRASTNDTASYRLLIDSIRRFDGRAQLQRIAALTLIVTGDRDAVVPHSCQQQLVRGIAQARWHIVRDSGHATPIDQPEEFNRVVLKFLKDIE
jgi:pimeloyl-ACP methyl ester carboxylesterase